MCLNVYVSSQIQSLESVGKHDHTVWNVLDVNWPGTVDNTGIPFEHFHITDMNPPGISLSS